MRWSDLSDQPERLQTELSRVGMTARVLKADVRDVPELRERCKTLSGPALLLLALQWFGDEEHSQPTERTSWHGYGRTPDWGHLPQLASALDDESPVTEPETDGLLGGLPYMKADYEAAGKLHKAGKMTVEGIEQRREMSTKRAYRIYRQFRADAVVYDDAGLHPGRGYRWDPAGLDKDPPGYTLIRA